MIWTYVCLHLCKHYLLVSQGLVLQLDKNIVFYLNSISRNNSTNVLVRFMLPNFYDPKIWQLHQNVGNIPINYQNFFCPILKIFPSEILIIIKKKYFARKTWHISECLKNQITIFFIWNGNYKKKIPMFLKQIFQTFS